MMVAGTLVAGAVLLGWLAPASLSRLGGRGSPGLQLTWWLALTGAVMASVVAGAILLLFGDHPHLQSGPLDTCLAIFGHRHVHPADELLGAFMIGVLCVVAARAGISLRRRIVLQQRAHRAHLTALGTASASRSDGVLWLEHDTPFAYSIAGRPGLVVASTALNSLPRPHRDAVLRHERHHLRHRHHWIVIATDTINDALPRIPLFRAAAAATRTLTELSADDSAARHCGTDAVAGALMAMGKPQDSTALRLHRLSTATRPPQHTLAPRLLACLTSSLLPAILGGALLGTVVVLAC